MKKLGHILRGWGKSLGLVATTPAEMALARLRVKICGPCEASKKSSFIRLLHGKAEVKTELFCTRCSCSCFEKGLVIEETCPLGKW